MSKQAIAERRLDRFESVAISIAEFSLIQHPGEGEADVRPNSIVSLEALEHLVPAGIECGSAPDSGSHPCFTAF
jgi:hypothetical protein